MDCNVLLKFIFGVAGQPTNKLIMFVCPILQNWCIRRRHCLSRVTQYDHSHFTQYCYCSHLRKGLFPSEPNGWNELKRLSMITESKSHCNIILLLASYQTDFNPIFNSRMKMWCVGHKPQICHGPFYSVVFILCAMVFCRFYPLCHGILAFLSLVPWYFVVTHHIELQGWKWKI